MSVVLTYNGYELEGDGSRYQGRFGNKVIKFDTPSMWVQYINYIEERHGKTREENYRRQC